MILLGQTGMSVLLLGSVSGAVFRDRLVKNATRGLSEHRVFFVRDQRGFAIDPTTIPALDWWLSQN